MFNLLFQDIETREGSPRPGHLREWTLLPRVGADAPQGVQGRDRALALGSRPHNGRVVNILDRHVPSGGRRRLKQSVSIIVSF